MQLCTPAMIYLVLSCLSLVISAINSMNPASILIQLIFTGAWTWLMNYLCKKGYSILSWLLLFFPFLVGVFVVINLFSKLSA